MRHLLTVSVCLWGLAGCATTPAPCDCTNVGDHSAEAELTAPRDQDVRVGDVIYDAQGRARPAEARPTKTRRAARGLRSTGADRYATRSLGTIQPRQNPRPRRVGRRNIAVKQARLDNALRVIADAGNFNLVTEGSLSKTVTIRLKAVEPYDALLALAQAHQLSIRYRDGIVVARAGRSTPSP